MKLLSIVKNVPYGEAPAWAWIVFATFKDAPGWGLFFHLPLFVNRETYRAGSGRCGRRAGTYR